MKSNLHRDLARFAALTALITLGVSAAILISGADIREGAGFWMFGVATAGPSLAALILWLSRAARSTRTPQPVSAPWLWLPAALILGAAPTVIANLVVDPAHVAAAVSNAPLVFAEFGGALAFVALFTIAGPLAEEFGWRGFAQPRIRQRLGVVGTSVVLGAAWAVWHVPLYFLPGTGQYETGLFTIDGLLFVVSCVPLSLLYLFVSERLGGRVWAAILIHFSGNAIGAFLPSEEVAVGAIQLVTTFALAAAVLVLWGSTRGRLADPALGSGLDAPSS